MRPIIVVFGALLVLVATVVAFFAVALRTKQPVMLGVIRKINRRVFNPHQMKTAGAPGAYAAVVRHVGRVSGTVYETPIVVRELADRFVIVLPYARQADWVKNLCAGAGGEIEYDGATWVVDDLRFGHLDEVSAAMSDKEARQNRLAGSTDVLSVRAVRRAPTGEPNGRTPSA